MTNRNQGQVPLLFDKWKPIQFENLCQPDEEVVDGRKQLNYIYHFPEGFVEFILDTLP